MYSMPSFVLNINFKKNSENIKIKHVEINPIPKEKIIICLTLFIHFFLFPSWYNLLTSGTKAVDTLWVKNWGKNSRDKIYPFKIPYSVIINSLE